MSYVLRKVRLLLISALTVRICQTRATRNIDVGKFTLLDYFQMASLIRI